MTDVWKERGRDICCLDGMRERCLDRVEERRLISGLSGGEMSDV